MLEYQLLWLQESNRRSSSTAAAFSFRSKYCQRLFPPRRVNGKQKMVIVASEPMVNFVPHPLEVVTSMASG